MNSVEKIYKKIRASVTCFVLSIKGNRNLCDNHITMNGYYTALQQLRQMSQAVRTQRVVEIRVPIAKKVHLIAYAI